MIRLLSGSRRFLSRSLGSSTLPVIETMRSILGSDENAVRVLKKLGSRRGLPSPKCLGDNVELLRSRGMSREAVSKLMLMYPGLFCRKMSSLEALIERVEGMLGIRMDMNMFAHGLYVLGSMSDEKLDAKFGAFRSYGWDDSDILIMARANPLVLAISELKVKSGLDYYMKQLGYHPKFIAAHPALLGYSMEKRVRPRNAVLQALKEKKLIQESFGLYTALLSTESEFLESEARRALFDVF
ncbi:Transcription termination factor MTERF8, chloroplastic-like protein [Drosera capensis]